MTTHPMFYDADEPYRHHSLDLDYIVDAARQIAAALAAGATAEIAYQPGDMTHYGLIFAPLAAVRTVAPAGGRRDYHAARGSVGTDGAYPADAFVVALLGDGSFPGGAHPAFAGVDTGYLAERLNIENRTSAVSVAVLVRAVADLLGAAVTPA